MHTAIMSATMPPTAASMPMAAGDSWIEDDVDGSGVKSGEFVAKDSVVVSVRKTEVEPIVGGCTGGETLKVDLELVELLGTDRVEELEVDDEVPEELATIDEP